MIFLCPSATIKQQWSPSLPFHSSIILQTNIRRNCPGSSSDRFKGWLKLQFFERGLKGTKDSSVDSCVIPLRPGPVYFRLPVSIQVPIYSFWASIRVPLFSISSLWRSVTGDDARIVGFKEGEQFQDDEVTITEVFIFAQKKIRQELP